MLYRYLFLPPGMEQENILFFFMLLRGKTPENDVFTTVLVLFTNTSKSG